MVYSKYPLIIPGRRYRLPDEISLAPLRSEDIRRASKQLIPDFLTSEASCQALRVSDPQAEPEAPCSSSRTLSPYAYTLRVVYATSDSRRSKTYGSPLG